MLARPYRSLLAVVAASGPLLSAPAAAASIAAAGDVPAVHVRADARHLAVEAAGRQSNDPRLRILFAPHITDAASVASDEFPLAALIDGTKGSTDPLVLQLLLDRCRNAPSTCDAVALARRWTVVEPQGVIPWIELAAVLDETGDVRGADEAWTHAAHASSFHDPGNVVTRVVWSQVSGAADMRDRYLDAVYAIGVAAAVQQRWLSDGTVGCRRLSRASDCAVVADVVFRDADSIVALQFARAMTAGAGGPDWLVAERRRTEDALRWACLQIDGGADVDTLDDATLATLVGNLQKLIETGDLTLAKDVLRERRVSDVEASRLSAIDRAARTRLPQAH